MTRVYLSRETDPVAAIRVGSALTRTQLMGEVSTANFHPLTGFDIEPLGDETPDVVVASTQIPPGLLGDDVDTAIWRNERVEVFSVGGEMARLMPPPAPLAQRVTLSGVQVRDDGIEFAATFVNPTSEHWTSQDWVVLDADASLWATLQSLESGRGTNWFAGQIDPRPGNTTFHYTFGPAKGELLVRGADGTSGRAAAAGRGLSVGRWLLAMRLRDHHRKAHLFPLIRFEILASGSTRYEAEGAVSRASSDS